MSKEGLGLIMGCVLLSAITILGALLTPHIHLTVFAILVSLLTLLVVSFFRDPDRNIPEGSNLILAPADGKIVEIQEEFEGQYLQEKATRVSIFLSVFDVHINRIPVSGEVDFLRYKKGSFVKAYKSEASEINEQTLIGIKNEHTKILFKQIAGLIARRIVCHVREGSKVKSGDRFGMIKFGSRVDVFLPTDAELKVKLNEKVKGGESILGVFR